jgi:hypothetical protein
VDVIQCPECELRFRSPAELDQHLALDHPDFRAQHKGVDEIELSAARRRKHIRSQAPEEQ